MKTVLHFLNENHQYAIAAVVIAAATFWAYGCQSQVNSLLNPTQQITRPELQAEIDFLIAQAEIKFTDLNKQDQIKQALLDLGSTFATTGTLNPTGLLNTAVSIAAIAFGLNRNQKLKVATAKNSTNSA